MTGRMRAVTYARYGSPDVLGVTELPRPEYDASQVRVQVVAAGLNPLDWKLARGDFRLLRGRHWPRQAGCDFAGRIESVGTEVIGWKPGDRVFGSLRVPLHGRRGSLAQFLVASPAEFTRLPDAVSFRLGAALPMAGISALQCLELGGVRSGSELLVIGGAGGLGSIAIRLASDRGARVTAVGRPGQADYMRRLGASGIADRNTPFASGATYDAIIDASATYSFGACSPHLKPKGCWVQTVPNASVYLSLWRSRILGGKQVHALMMQATLARLEELARAAEGGRFADLAVASARFEQSAAALERVRAGGGQGKLVVDVALDAPG